ncbi:MAG: alpha-1,4-glucan--maltose-1-phosphate maltosyltransferase [Bacteroidales bacterium]
MNGQQRVIIENLKPDVDSGAFPVKRVVNEKVSVEADIYSDGHDVLNAELYYRFSDDTSWQTSGLNHEINDRWSGSFRVTRLGTYLFTVSAWVDHFRTWHRDILKKIEAATDFSVDLLVGAELIQRTLNVHKGVLPENKKILEQIQADFSDREKETAVATAYITGGILFRIMSKYPVRNYETRYHREVEISVEQEKANFSSWYEVFPRSLGEGGKHGTFRDCIGFLPYVAEMGFDVLYLPPVHPIGKKHRKGKNNSTVSEPGDPGSPWAIGSSEGGHKSIHPELGTLEDFRELVKKASASGIHIALDIAFQCSPDHPYVKEHPEWFRKRPDGSLQYAENPPKKYEDIYPLNFETDDWKNLWEELKSVFLYWIRQGVKIFRVDNPHTKSLRFWGWVIREIRREHPDTVFLSEAFTRPKVMYHLAKQGFSQSYTYFTWRNTRYELTTYMEELVNTDVREFFRPNLWPNTPDILPEYLQFTNRSGFIQRFILAATLSSNYGIYGPAFELMEQTPVNPGKEEYLDSEKYEIRQWDLHQKGSLKKIIGRVNRIRKENSALQNTRSLKFHSIDNEALMCYTKTSENLDNIILVVVNLDPFHTHSGWIRLPLETFDMDPGVPFQVHDLLSGSYFLWSGEHNYVEIDPGVVPAHIFKIRRKVRSERDFDYFM